MLDYKIGRYNNGDAKEDIDQEVYKEYGYPLLAEEVSVGTNTDGPAATNAIFGQGASFETLFEITYRNPVLNRDYDERNSAVTNMYGTDSRTQNVLGATDLIEGELSADDSYSDKTLFSVVSDYRSIASFYYNSNDGGVSNIYKYVIEKNTAGAASAAASGRVGVEYKSATQSQTYRSNQPNWILYRLTEIMLFRAEAEIELAFNMEGRDTEQTDDEQETDDEQNVNEENDSSDSESEGATSKMRKASVLVRGNSLSTPDELKEDAFNLISAVYRRSNPYVYKEPKYAPKQPQDYDGFHKLLMNERRREFLFEGKRFFDLVRSARRNGNTLELRQALQTKYGEAAPAVTIKLVQMGFMYMPVYKKEMKINPALVQNECYLDEEENKKQ